MSFFIMQEEHELWLKTDGKEGKQLCMAGKDLSKQNLADSMIIAVIFDKANMINVDLSYSNLCYSSFNGANIKNSSLIKADANHTTFFHATVKDLNAFRTSFIEADFSGANLIGVNFQKCLLLDANFTYANISGCKFFNASLDNAKGFETVTVDWIDIGQNENPQKIYGIEAIQWLVDKTRISP